jgi:glutamine synthetase
VQDNTDRNRTSPFAFTGAKFEFRAVGGSQSIAFPVMLLQAAVAEAIDDLIVELKKALKTSKTTGDAVLAVVQEAFKSTAAIRFEGNNYSDEWVVEARKRELPNMRRTPEALAELVNATSRALFAHTGVLTEAELDSRYHIRLERYNKDLLIEMHTLQQMVDTQILPACYTYLGDLAADAGRGASSGINLQPLINAANTVSNLVASLQKARTDLSKVLAKAEAQHDDIVAQGEIISTAGREAMDAVRAASDTLELTIGDTYWPLPRYREMLFPV